MRLVQVRVCVIQWVKGVSKDSAIKKVMLKWHSCFAIRTKCRWQLRMLLLFPSFPVEKLTLCWPRKPWQNQSSTLCSPCDLLRCNISWVGKDRSSWQRRAKVESWKFSSNTDPKEDSGFHIGFLMGFNTDLCFFRWIGVLILLGCGFVARLGYEKALKCSCTTRLHSYGESFSMHKIKIWPQFSGVDFASRLSCLSPLFEKDTFGKSKSTEDTSNFVQDNWDQSQVWASASIPELRQRLVVAM